MSGKTPPNRRAFPSTHWSQITELAGATDAERRERLERFARRYWSPVYHYICAIRPKLVGDAEDLTQEFFAMLLSRLDFAKLDREQGGFRQFLKTALYRFVISAYRKEAARRPAEPGGRVAVEAADELGDPGTIAALEEAFDRAWIQTVLAEALADLKAELLSEGKALYFELFRAYCLEPEDGVTYESLAGQHGLKVDDVRNHLFAVRQRGRRVIKRVLGAYLPPGSDLEAESRFILFGA